jgi:hypothetical protein
MNKKLKLKNKPMAYFSIYFFKKPFQVQFTQNYSYIKIYF